MRDLQIMVTGDGSHTLWLPELKESFHSMHGAITESQHVFIGHGLNYLCQSSGKDTIHILELGLGTGLNAILTCCYSQKHKQKVKYTALEPLPLSWKLVSQLNYNEQISHSQTKLWFNQLHSASWGKFERLNAYFSILKKSETIQNQTISNHYDLCYFDAFAPGKQPEVWDLSVLDIVRKSLKPSGVLVTYCAQGQFKRNLKQLGFQLESLPGPPGKKEMTRAVLQV